MAEERDPDSISYELPPAHYELERLLELIGGDEGVLCRRIYSDYRDVIDTGPGSRDSHHAWPGGYKHHVEQTMNYFFELYDLSERYGHLDQLPEEEKFTISDGILVLFLHDIEKPFMYSFDEDGTIKYSDLAMNLSKAERKQFRQSLIEDYGLELTDNQANALEHVEGVRDDNYIPGERVDKPLAALCHAADNYSARVLYNLRRSY